MQLSFGGWGAKSILIMRVEPLRQLLPGVLTALTAFAGAAIVVQLNRGFGAGDLAAFAIWCTILGIIVSVLASLLARYGLPRARWHRAMYGFGVGALTGVLFILAMALGLGPWIGAFSFPVLYLCAGAAALSLSLAFAVAPPSDPATALVPRPPGGRWAKFLRVGAVLLGMLALVAITPIALVFGSVFFWGRAEREVHLLPAGFRGPVVILFNDANGAPTEREGKARRYTIPPDGVLRTKFRQNPGWSKPDYFHVRPDGQRWRIVTGLPCANSLPGDPVQACLMSQMSLSNRPSPPYSAYIVGRQAEQRSHYDRGDSLVRKVVYGESVTEP